MDLEKASPEELLRYSRHMVIPEVGPEGQRKLGSARVLCVGAGGLGSPALLYLAAAGVGTLGIVDRDTVDLSNLQRQIVHGTGDVGHSKLESARKRLESLNPGVELELHDVLLSSSNALEIIGAYDLVIDGTDNFAARYLINDACFLSSKPDVYGSIFRFDGQVSIFGVEGGPCYRCLYPEPPEPGLIPNCAEAGVLGVLPGIVGTIQATEAIKLILGIGEPLVGRLLLFDALRMEMRSVTIGRNADCSLCGDHPTVRELIDYEDFCGVRTEMQTNSNTEMTVHELKERMDANEAPTLLDVREPYEVRIASIPGATTIPLGELRGRLGELNRDSEIVVMCRTGKRSDMAARFLRDQGYRARNLTGGIHAWSEQIDPTQPKY